MSSKSAINELNESDTQSSLEDFISLLKPRVMSLAIFTSISGLILSPTTLHPFLCVLSIFCISLGAGASGAINMWFDRDIDKMMERTKNRPIPSKKIMAGDALGFGIILSLVSVIVLGLSVNYFAAFLLALSIIFYIFIYTIWLKRRTTQNIVIGGAAGAFPPVIGWACATGDVSTFPIILFVLIFIWTPPHFWALALYKDTEYSIAKIYINGSALGEADSFLNLQGSANAIGSTHTAQTTTTLSAGDTVEAYAYLKDENGGQGDIYSSKTVFGGYRLVGV